MTNKVVSNVFINKKQFVKDFILQHQNGNVSDDLNVNVNNLILKLRSYYVLGIRIKMLFSQVEGQDANVVTLKYWPLTADITDLITSKILEIY